MNDNDNRRDVPPAIDDANSLRNKEGQNIGSSNETPIERSEDVDEAGDDFSEGWREDEETDRGSDASAEQPEPLKQIQEAEDNERPANQGSAELQAANLDPDPEPTIQPLP